MIDRKRVLDLIANVRKSLGRLRKFSLLSFDEFRSDYDNFAVAEHHLRKVLEAILDIGRHIIARQGLGRPEDYTQIFEILGQEGILPENYVKQNRGLPGYRNRLVHVYHEVTSEEIFEIIQTKLSDLDEFCKLIIEYIAETSDS